MKKIITILLSVLLVMTIFTGCGSKKNNSSQTNSSFDINYANEKLYQETDVKEYTQVTNYMGIEIDSASSNFVSYYDAIAADDAVRNDLYDVLREGKVMNGDIVNLDYTGKIDGVVFAGGSATGANLEIGSGTFIDDFEEELIGVAVGETKDVTATFPNPYQNNPDLAGKEAIFTCKINFITRHQTPEQSYAKMKFDSAQAYKDDITKRAAKKYIRDTITANAFVKSYPEMEYEIVYDAVGEYYNDLCEQNGITLEYYAGYAYGMTVDQFKEKATEAELRTSMIMQYILEMENLVVSEAALNSQGIGLPKAMAQIMATEETVLEHLVANAKIK